MSTDKLIGNLKRLDLRTRNKIRAMASMKQEEKIRALNDIRMKSTSYEILQIEGLIRSYPVAKIDLPDYFPDVPQVHESYFRLSPLPAKKQLAIIDNLVLRYSTDISEFIILNDELSQRIVDSKYEDAQKIISDSIKLVGYSHFLMRKACVIRSMPDRDHDLVLDVVEDYIGRCGISRNNVFVTSVLNSYHEKQDYLSIKKAIMSLPPKGDSNQFTRDMTRMAFHPHARDMSDYEQMLYSNLQSSLVDAIIFIKINKTKFPVEKYPNLARVVNTIEGMSVSLGCLAEKYISANCDDVLFYQHSSAWLESDNVVEYRFLNDHYYDSPEASYLSLDNDTLLRALSCCSAATPSDLLSRAKITDRGIPSLEIMEAEGHVSRSSLFNALLQLKEGGYKLSESDLFNLMSLTRDLDRTINLDHARTFANNGETTIYKMIVYFLIFKRSKLEKDNHALRKLIETEVGNNHAGRLSDFIASMGSHNRVIAEYIYDVCTEDFIGQLYRIIDSALDITETRAALHRWKGEVTGEKVYTDRARQIIIDHQISQVRGEIDDNRIYVDAARFGEWLNDHLVGDLSSTLTAMQHNNTLIRGGDHPQIYQIIERCYQEFCLNNYFGIASYLGRRIRHGTFKGHMYSSVVQLERQVEQVLGDQALALWARWKKQYEDTIDKIINERLHVESISRRNGFLKPHLRNGEKPNLAKACINEIINQSQEGIGGQSFVSLLIDYCWRFAEVDLVSMNGYLKSLRGSLVKSDILEEIKTSSSGAQDKDRARDFVREVHARIDDKLKTMYGWFKRPVSVSPKASIQLLYKAVIKEVSETFPDFNPATELREEDNIEIIGGAYHVLYDAFFVVIHNAARHGKKGGDLSISINRLSDKLIIDISSEISAHESEHIVESRMMIPSGEDVSDAQVCENRSGIKKLYHLAHGSPDFGVDSIVCRNRRVTVTFSYRLAH